MTQIDRLLFNINAAGVKVQFHYANIVFWKYVNKHNFRFKTEIFKINTEMLAGLIRAPDLKHDSETYALR